MRFGFLHFFGGGAHFRLGALKALVVALGAVVFASVAWGYVYNTSSGQVVVWSPGTVPLKIMVDDATVLSDGTTRAGSIVAAAQAWNAQIATVQFSPQIAAVGAGGSHNGINEVFFTNTVYGSNWGFSTLGVTVRWFSGTQATEGDVLFNPAFTWDSYRGNSGSQEDIRRVALHELGHVLGLDHPDLHGQSVTAVMNSTISDIDALQPDDIVGAQTLYGTPGGGVAPAITSQPQPQSIYIGHSTTFSVTASGTAPLTYRWQSYLPAFSVWADLYDDVLHSNTGTATLTILGAGGVHGANSHLDGTIYRCVVTNGIGSATSDGALLRVTTPPPVITFQPGDQTVIAGQTAQFLIGVDALEPISYLWQRLPSGSSTWVDLSNGGNYSPAQHWLYVVCALGMTGDQFRCVVTNAGGSITSAAALLTVTAPVAPSITLHPQDQTVLEGDPVTFSASASGVPTPTLQWQKNNVDISGATGTTFTIASVAPSDAGSYTLVATNLAGTATSNPAVLAVSGLPVITVLSSTRQVLLPGGSVNLNVSATSSTGSVTYQWVHNGLDLVGATGTTLSLPSVTYRDAGWYVAVASNSYGSRRSAPIFVLVAPAKTEIRAWGNGGYGEAIPADLTDAIAISAGEVHGLALKRDGTVVAWGANDRHQTNVPAGLANVVAISAGPVTSTALKSDGSVVGWGDGNTLPAGLTDIVAIAGGENYTIGLKSDGTVLTWGGYVTTPNGLPSLIAITAGDSFRTGLKADGTVVAWGSNPDGRASVPPGLTGVIAIASGRTFSMALKADGTVTDWGSNTNNNVLPVVPAGLNGVTAVDAGSYHALALKSDGTVVGWGTNDYGQITPPPGLGNVIAISGSAIYSLALRDSGSDTLPVITTQPVSQTTVVEESVTFTVAAISTGQLTYQWRKNTVAIGGATTPTLTLSNLPTTASGNYDVVVTNQVGSVISDTAVLTVNTRPIVTATGLARQVLVPNDTFNLSVSASGTGALYYQWFRNGVAIGGSSATHATLTRTNVTVQDSGWYVAEVTDNYGTTRSTAMFVAVMPLASAIRAWGSNVAGETSLPAGLSGALAVSAGLNFSSLALKRDGTVAAWGDPNARQLNIPPGLSNVVQVAAGTSYALALKSDGTVVAWSTISYPAVPANLSKVVQIGTGYISIALRSDGTVVCWDSDGNGNSNPPAGLNHVIAVSAGSQHVLALKSDGTVVAWGNNAAGQTNVPAGLSGVVAISAGSVYSLALKSDGTVVSWGYNGDSAATPPVGLTGVTAIDGGQVHSLALKNDGTLVGWGNNNYGQSAPPAGLANVLAISSGIFFSLALYDGSAEAAPIITDQPASTTRVETQSVTFSVTAASASAMSHQWRRNAVDLAGQTGPTLTLGNLGLSDAGNYSVAVTNNVGTTISNDAVLTVLSIPVVTLQSPTRNVVQPGQSLNLSVSATGTGPISYQWKRNGRFIVGATSATLVLTGITFADRGYYIVDVADSNGLRHSTAMFVVVAPTATEVVGWGVNSQDQLNVPANLNDAVAIAAGAAHTLALRANGTVVAWGDTNYGQTNVPPGLDNVVAIAAGGGQSLALKADGTVVKWGNTPGGFPMPADLTNVVSIAAGFRHVLALKNDGAVVAWGDVQYSQSVVPPGLGGTVALAAGTQQSIAMNSSGTLTAWGGNYFGQQQVPGEYLTGNAAIAATDTYSMALQTNGTVVMWGGFNAIYPLLRPPVSLINVTDISCGPETALALKSDGSVFQWATYVYGHPDAPVNLSRVLAISQGGLHSIALRNASLLTAPSGDFNGDSKSDILLTNTVTGDRAVWLMNGMVIGAGAYLPAQTTNWVFSGIGDFDSDGKSDIILSNTSTGDRAIWLMNGMSIKAGVYLGALSINWSISGTGDFNGDGKSDILLTDTVTGDRALWLMNGTSIQAGVYLPSQPISWEFSGIGDFDGDGKSDILLTDTTTGDRAIWLMDGTSIKAGVYLGVQATVWTISGIGDFNADGKSDVLLTNTATGDRAMWLMNGAAISAGAYLPAQPTSWVFSRVGDFNGDGKADIFLTDTVTGGRAVWLMDGTSVSAGQYLGALSTNWIVIR